MECEYKHEDLNDISFTSQNLSNQQFEKLVNAKVNGKLSTFWL